MILRNLVEVPDMSRYTKRKTRKRTATMIKLFLQVGAKKRVHLNRICILVSYMKQKKHAIR